MYKQLAKCKESVDGAMPHGPIYSHFKSGWWKQNKTRRRLMKVFSTVNTIKASAADKLPYMYLTCTMFWSNTGAITFMQTRGVIWTKHPQRAWSFLSDERLDSLSHEPSKSNINTSPCPLGVKKKKKMYSVNRISANVKAAWIKKLIEISMQLVWASLMR